jgi:hypothetical protein
MAELLPRQSPPQLAVASARRRMWKSKRAGELNQVNIKILPLYQKERFYIFRNERLELP